jgi:RNA polymerase sigma-70 factor (ECF subfamily)
VSPPADEAFLVRAARRGDLDAFGELMRRHEQPTYRLALRMLGSAAEAEDAAQDAFLRAWRSLPKFEGSSSFSTWLYRITTNRCLNIIAARRPSETLDETRAGDRRDDPATRAQQREELSALTASIGRLPAEQRAALVLREFEGLSYDEVADVLQISLAAVKGRIHRARAQIAVDLAGFR